jgi:predicted lactoylglutathione lyase
MMTIFSVMHKQIINDIASKKKAFEQGGRVGTFLDGQVVGGEYGRYFESPEGNCNGSGGQYPIFLEKSEQVKD